MAICWSQICKIWSSNYFEKADMFDIVRVKVKSKSDKSKGKVYWKFRCFKCSEMWEW